MFHLIPRSGHNCGNDGDHDDCVLIVLMMITIGVMMMTRMMSMACVCKVFATSASYGPTGG